MGIDAVTTRENTKRSFKFLRRIPPFIFLVSLNTTWSHTKMQRSIGDRKPNNIFLKGIIFELFQVFLEIFVCRTSRYLDEPTFDQTCHKIKTSAVVVNKTICQIQNNAAS